MRCYVGNEDRIIPILLGVIIGFAGIYFNSR